MHGSDGWFEKQDTNTWRFDLYTKTHVLHTYIYIYMLRIETCIFLHILRYVPILVTKKHGWLGYIRDYATQLYGDYFINHEIRIPIKQPV